jgi:hypothetical protein
MESTSTLDTVPLPVFLVLLKPELQDIWLTLSKTNKPKVLSAAQKGMVATIKELDRFQFNN